MNEYVENVLSCNVKESKKTFLDLSLHLALLKS